MRACVQLWSIGNTSCQMNIWKIIIGEMLMHACISIYYRCLAAIQVFVSM